MYSLVLKLLVLYHRIFIVPIIFNGITVLIYLRYYSELKASMLRMQH